jgi:hypothetical protein
MKQFDLDAAKRGEIIQHQLGGQWVDVSFIGVARDGEIVVQFKNGCISLKRPDELCMAPMKHIVYVNVMAGGAAAWFSRREAAENARHTYPVIARAVPVEIEE